MSLTGHERRFGDVGSKSVDPPIADMTTRIAIGRNGPTAEVSTSLNHFVGAKQKRFWNGETECFRGLEVDH